MRHFFVLVPGAFLGTNASPAFATFSLVAVNADTGESGVAIASCVGADFDLAEAVRLDPAWGALVAQGAFSAEDCDALVAELAAGASPEAALGVVTDSESSDGLSASHRQFAIVGRDGARAAWSGSDLGEVALDREERFEGWSLSLQGNLLEDARVLDALLVGFSAEEATLERRLALALAEVVRSGFGDSRCAPETADAYFLARLDAGGARWERSGFHERAADALAWLAGLTEPPPPEEPENQGVEPVGCLFGGTTTARPFWGGVAVVLALVALRRRSGAIPGNRLATRRARADRNGRLMYPSRDGCGLP